MSSTIAGSDRPLTELFDVAMLDLDGVVYVGKDAVPGVPAALAKARDAGMRLAFVTNNAARPPSAVAAHLTELGIAAHSAEVITSSQAAARYLSDRLAPGMRVLVVGTTGLTEALHERGLVPVSEVGSGVDAVVQGYSPTLDWAMLAEGAVAINSGAMWVATNVDPTVPSPRGPLPGNGALVAALQCATRVDPIVTGKPDPTMHRETLVRTGSKQPIVVGDRLDTDIEGANAVGCPSLLVLSGVTTARDLLSARPALRPTYLAADASGLLTPHPQPTATQRSTDCGRWSVTPTEGGWSIASSRGLAEPGEPVGGAPADLSNDGPTDDDLDALRALCAAQWDAGDGPDDPVVSAADGDGDAQAVLGRLGLAT